MRQLGIRILNSFLFALCSFQVATVFNRVAAEALRTPPAYELPATPEHSRPDAASKDRRVILDRNLFGAAIGPQPVVSEPVEVVEETKLPLALEATIAASGTTNSRASIHDTRARSSMVVSVGDPLTGYPNVSVALIERGRVVLLNAGRHEELLLEDGVPALIPARRPSARALSSRKRPAVRSPAGPSRRVIGEQLEAGDLSRDEVREMLESMAEAQLLKGQPK